MPIPIGTEGVRSSAALVTLHNPRPVLPLHDSGEV